jgi:hypothetical protein
MTKRLDPWEVPWIRDFRGLNRARPSASDRGLVAAGATSVPVIASSQADAVVRVGGAAVAASPESWQSSRIFMGKNHFAALQKVFPEDAAHLRLAPASSAEIRAIALSFDKEARPQSLPGLHKLQVDQGHQSLKNAFRWRLLSEVANAGETVLVRSVSANQFRMQLHMENPEDPRGAIHSTITPAATMVNPGETLPSRRLHRQAYGSLVEPLRTGRKARSGSTSWSEDTTLILLANEGPQIATPRTVAHELLGHAWFATQKLPSAHPDRVPPSVSTPNGETFNGSVINYIEQFIAPTVQ